MPHQVGPPAFSGDRPFLSRSILYDFSLNPILVSVGELRQKMIELHTIKTKKGNVEVEITMNKEFDMKLHALMLSTGHIGHRMEELAKCQNKIAAKNV